MFLLEPLKELITAVSCDSPNTTVSCSVNGILFKEMYVISSSSIFSAYIPRAPEIFPLNISPISKSPVFPVPPVRDVNFIWGAEASLESVDSYIAWILIISGTFNAIVSSWTLVPYG